MNWKKDFEYWIENSPPKIKDIINSYTEEEKNFYFGKELSFGTAGLRGVMGYGSSLINEYNIAKYALAFGKTILQKYGNSAKEKGIIIAHDNRRNNILFSETCAKVISALGIPVFFFNSNNLQPTPLLSFTIANGNYLGGINITASHNTPEYNGIKVYSHTGAQMLPEDTDLIVKFSKEDINIFNIEQSTKNIQYLSEDVEKEYIETLIKSIPFEPINKEKKIKIVFTAQHGTAGPFAKEILEKMEVEHYFVKEQMIPDPEFSNTKSANPQDSDSFILAREYGNKYNADVIFCTDPDADRFGVEVKHNGEWVHINGNQLPMIQLEYKLKNLKKMNYLNKGDFVVRSVVTSTASDKIAEKYNVDVYENLTGFKWLISEALKHEIKGNECLFVWEESYGSTIRTFTRDKDSFQALIQLIEIINTYKNKNKTLVDVLEEIFNEIGYYETSQKQIKFNELNGIDIMNSYIEKAKNLISGEKIEEFQIEKIIDFSKGYKNLNKENFVMIIFENNTRVTLRPSGTEAVLRIYFDVPDISKEKAIKKIKILEKAFSDFTMT